MEIWDVYDENRIKTGRTMVRGEPFKEDDYHIVANVCVFNSDGKMLIQQRQPFKEGWSNMWDITAGGSAVAGDSSRDAAEREIMEEIGLEIDLKGVHPKITITIDNCFNDFYVITQDVDISSLKLQYEEVQAVKWADAEEIKSLIAENKFIPYHTGFIDLLFHFRTRTGTLAHGEGK